MALVPTKYTQDRIPLPEPDDAAFTAPGAAMIVECGYYSDPAGRFEDILIEKITQTVSYYSRVVSREEELWEYEVPGGPPVRYERNVYGRAYLPEVNPGRRYMLMETETAEFYPWSAFQPASVNLSSVRRKSGYVVYDTNYDHLSLTAEEQQKLEEGGLTPWGPPRLIVHSARTWREASRESSIVRSPSAPQTTKWVDPFEVVSEMVWEYPDRYDIYRVTEERIREGAPRIEGPEVQRKELWEYRLGVPIDPPEVKASQQGDDGIRVELSGGGATWNGRRIHPDRYKVLRRVATNPGRAASGDPYGIYDSDPAPVGRRKILTHPSVTDLAGAPASALPAQAGYTEPGDTSEPERDGWSVIAELENEQPRDREGRASVLDNDVLTGGEYEYAGVAVIGSDESPPSQPVTVTYGGADHSSSIKVRLRKSDDGLEADVLRPEEEGVLDADYGETLVFDLPIAVYEEDGSAEDLAEEIAGDWFAAEADSRARIRVTANLPLVTLEAGQRIGLPQIELKIIGNQLQLDSEIEETGWMLEGFRLEAKRNGDRIEGIDRTDLELVQP